MSTPLLPALRRNLVLFAFVFAVASEAFGTIVLSSPPTSEAAASTLTSESHFPLVTNCEFLPTGDVNNRTVYR